MKTKYQEAYKLIEETCDLKLGIGEKHLLRKILDDSEERGVYFIVNGAQYVLRRFNDYYPRLRNENWGGLKKARSSEIAALNCWRKRYNHLRRGA